MNIGFIDADLLDNGTNFPNLTLMKLAGNEINKGNKCFLADSYNDLKFFDKIFLAKVFDYTKVPEKVLKMKNVVYGGSGFYYDKAEFLPENIEHTKPYYDLYKGIQGEYYNDYSIGYTTKGCFRKCWFCINKRFDKCSLHSPVEEFLDKNKKYICCIDDNVLACGQWEKVIRSLQDTGKRFQFKQGIDIRLLTDKSSKLLAESKYKGDYIFAFDNLNDKKLIVEKIKMFKEYTDKTMKLYVFCGFDGDINDVKSAFERISILKHNKCLPYIMRHSNYNNSKYRGTFINLARYCNQPSIFKKMTYEEFCLKCGGSTKKYFDELNKEYGDEFKKYCRETY